MAQRPSTVVRGFWSDLTGLRLSVARRSRELPLGWRLWTVGALALAVGAVVPFAVPVFGALFATLATCELDEIARDRGLPLGADWRAATRRFLCFGAALAGMVAHGMLALLGLAAALHGTDTIVLAEGIALTVAGFLIAGVIVRNWWQAPFLLVGVPGLLAGAVAGVWFALHLEPGRPATEVWLTNTVRLAIAFCAAGLLATNWPRSLSRPTGPLRLLTRMMLSLGFVCLLGLIAEPPGLIQRLTIEDAGWWSAFVLAALVGSVWVLSQATLPLTRDRRWFWSWLHQPRKPEDGLAGCPTGLVASLAFLPAVLATPVASNQAWLVLFCLGLASTLLHATQRTLARPAVVRQRPRTSAPASPATRVAAAAV